MKHLLKNNSSLLKTLLFFLFFCSLTFALSAQIVNIEDKRVSRIDTVGWFGLVDIGVSLVKNTKSITTVSANARVDYLNRKHLIFAISSYNLVHAGDSDFVNNGFQHFRYNYQFRPDVTYEAFSQTQYNEKLRIKLRQLVGTGFRWEVLEKEKQHAYLGAAYMYEYETLSDTTLIHRYHRLSTYLSFRLQFTPTLSYASTSYYQPILLRFRNARLTTSNSLTLKITNRLLFRTRFDLTYDGLLAEELEGVPATTYSFVNGLRWEF